MGKNKRERMKRRQAKLERRRARRTQGHGRAALGTGHAQQGAAADACPCCGGPMHDTIIHLPTAVDEVPPDLDERYDTVVERVIDDTVHRWLCPKLDGEDVRAEIRARANAYVPVEPESEPLLHCAECEEAREANRAGWCSDCQSFIFTTACEWATEDLNGENIVDLMCPKCNGGRWCCEIDEGDTPADQAAIARCAAAEHCHGLVECEKPDHWPPARPVSRRCASFC